MINSFGSTWKRWEPHAHTPETALNDQFNVSWDDYVATLEKLTPPLAGTGVTDYFTTEGYRKLRDYQTAGRLPGLFLFPNIEMRLALGTTDSHAVNIHLLVSPEDLDHLDKINDRLSRLTHRFLSEAYSCTPESLRQLGRAWQAHHTGRTPAQVRSEVDDVGALRLGANQYKVDFTALCQWRDSDPWLKANTLFAVPNGNDGAGGLPRDNESTFGSIREALRQASHVMLTSNSRDREFWLGRGTDDLATLQRKYGGCKPCLHGSDAHDLKRLTDPGERLCWIKAEPTWRGFLQIVAEPEDRLFIGPVPPDPPRTSWIKSITISGDPWCPAAQIDLNAGLVAVIGSRGAGKTALADLVAYGASAYEPGPASFLGKARRFVSKAVVSMTWGDDSVEQITIARRDLGTEVTESSDDEELTGGTAAHGRVLYLSQHFVEALCAPDGRRDRLGDEIERVVFERLDPDARLGTSRFRELLERETEALHDAKRVLEEEVRRRSQLIAQEHSAERRLVDMKKKLREIGNEQKRIDATLKKTAAPKAQEKQRLVTQAQEKVTKREEELAALALRVRVAQDLQVELRSTAEEVRRRTTDFLTRVKSVFPDLSESQAASFALAFSGDFESVLKKGLEKLQAEVLKLRGPVAAPFPAGCYMELKANLAAAQKALRDAGVVEKNLADLLKVQATKAAEFKTLNEQIQHAEKAKERIREHQAERLNCYKEIIAQLSSEEAILKRLYKPLEDELGGMTSSESRLALTVHRHADVAGWVERGERLFDMRKRHAVTEPDKLRQLAEQHLVPVWEGTADAAAAMAAVQKELGETSKLQDCFSAGATLEAFAAWLFSTDHIRVDYKIVFDGVNIEDLSPGTRGVVLLIIYLRLDTMDDRPLVIDQPEENLDPKSVFKDLVRFFKEARRRRQIIMITHNANLVVNADADQIIVANGTRGDEPGPPVLAYHTAVLEDQASQEEICSILEGGVEAFRQRDRRYKIAMDGHFDL